MGLDMNLYGYVPLWNAKENELPVEITVNDVKITITRDDVIKKELVYWRKANAIHKWFVDNCGNGVDECQEMFVSMEKIKELLDICKQVLYNKNNAPSLLPSMSGCFFGGIEYDEYYYESVKYTAEKLQQLIDDNLFSYVYYQASW